MSIQLQVNAGSSNLLTNVEQFTSCPICFEPYTVALKAIQASCSHITCTACKPTLSSCPICRVDWKNEASGPNVSYTEAAEKIAQLAAALVDHQGAAQRQQEEITRLQQQLQQFPTQIEQLQAEVSTQKQKKKETKERLREILQTSPEPATSNQSADEMESYIHEIAYRLEQTTQERDATVHVNAELTEENKKLKEENEELHRLIAVLMNQNPTETGASSSQVNHVERRSSMAPENFDQEDPKHLFNDIKNSLLYRENANDARGDAHKHPGISFFYPSTTVHGGVRCVGYKNSNLSDYELIKANINTSTLLNSFIVDCEKYRVWLVNN